jgi:hypothetical protein
MDAESMFDSVKKLLHFICKKFQRIHGGDMNDYISFSHEMFMDAFLSYDPSQGPFSKRITFLLWNRLLNLTKRKKTRREMEYPYELFWHHGAETGYSVQVEELAIPDREEHTPFDLEAFIESLSGDGKHAVRLVLAKEKGGKRPLKQRVKGVLREQFGWSGSKIKKTFKEVRARLYA